MHIIHQVGLEAEYFLRDKEGELVYPDKYGLPHDDFPLLGEIRAAPGETSYETVGYFVMKLTETLNTIEKKKLTADFTGFTRVSPEVRAKALRRAGNKYTPPCNNVYGTDIMSYTDDEIKDNKIVSCRLSAGLHIHFSRKVTHSWMNDDNREKWATANVLVPDQIKKIVKEMDTEALPKYQLNESLRYRLPGFYETKPWGFEYRSLPMVPAFTGLDDLRWVVNFSYSLLERLEK